MKSCSATLTLTAVLLFGCASVAFAQSTATTHALRPYDKDHAPSTCNGPCEINYNGGPVFEKAPTVYIIWYGNWKAKDRNIIDYYFAHLGGTTQEKINTTYSDSNGKSIPNKVKHSAKDDYHDNYSLGKNLSGDGDIQTIVANAIKNEHLPNDTDGIYFVLTYKDVTDSGFCSQFCGYHSPSTSIVKGETIKYSMVGDPDQCPSGCETSHILGDKSSPNNDPGADGATAIMWHEFSESSSDPEVNLVTAWAGNACGESGDCCAWLFGKVKTDKDGHFYTNVIGTKEYAMQQMFKLTTKSRSGNVPGVCKNTF
jgi:Phosphate-induced protein 1 conserved region